MWLHYFFLILQLKVGKLQNATNGTIKNARFSATATQSSLSLLAFLDFGLTERKLKLKGHCF